MSMRNGYSLNGKHFAETYSSGAVRQTHRFFIDGKLVTRQTYKVETIKAKKEEEEKRKLGSLT